MNDTGTLTLTEFLLARIAEDEAADNAARDSVGVSRAESASWSWIVRHEAEREAKRRIVERFAPSRNGYSDLLALLALPYADHPDYREEWRV